jgi:hypothetical protein
MGVRPCRRFGVLGCWRDHPSTVEIQEEPAPITATIDDHRSRHSLIAHTNSDEHPRVTHTATGTTVAQLPEPVPNVSPTYRSQHVHYEPGPHTRRHAVSMLLSMLSSALFPPSGPRTDKAHMP